MKITFVYTDYGQFNCNNFNRGVAILSACLKQAGFNTSLVHITKPLNKKEFFFLIGKHQPDLIAFSFITNMFSQIKKFSLWVKELGIPTLAGGVHPTVSPEECLAQEGINVICQGEGEAAIVDFCKAKEKGAEVKHIPNIWVKENGKIYKNPCRDLVENLDTLPYADYALFNYENLEECRLYKVLVIQASRGCVYNCTYCCNPLFRSLYPNKDKFLRYYSVDRLLDEVEWGLKKYPCLKEVRFYDDTLTQDKNWFKEFALKYKQRINLPYSGNERVENIDLETARELKNSGCYSLDLGIESGSNLIREKYMNRWMSNEKLVQAFAILKSVGIQTNSFNILGMVGETPKTILETIKLNAKVEPYRVFNAYFYPFRGTRAFEFVQEKGLLTKESVSSFFERPIAKLDTLRPEQLIFFYKYFYFLMRVYKILGKFSGDTGIVLKLVDRIITFRLFPYCIFNSIHFGKEDALILLRKSPRLYISLRAAYYFIREIRFSAKGLFRKIYFAFRSALIQLLPIKTRKADFELTGVRSILAIRIDRIGDLVVSLPAIEALKKIFPSAKISVLVRCGNDKLLSGVSWIDEVILYQGFIKTACLLRKKKFNLAVDLLMDYPLKPALLAYLSQTEFVAGFDIENKGRLFNLKLKPAQERKHVSQYMLDLIKMIAQSALIPIDTFPEQFYIKIPVLEQNLNYIKSFLKGKGVENSDILIGIHPGGHSPSQCWPIEKFAGLADRIIKKYQAKVIIMGSTNEKEPVDRMADLMQAEAIKFIGFSLDKLLALISCLTLFIGNNSGPLHLACALDIPTLSTLGPTDPALWWPKGKNHIVVKKDLPCSPCNRAICRPHYCMDLISIEDMLNAAQIIMDEIISNERQPGNYHPTH